MNKPELVRETKRLNAEIAGLKQQLEPICNKAYQQLERETDRHSIQWNKERNENNRLRAEIIRLEGLDAAKLQMHVDSMTYRLDTVKKLTSHLTHLINEGWIEECIREIKRFPGNPGRTETIGNKGYFE